MIKRVLVVILPIMLLVGIIAFVWWITDPNTLKKIETLVQLSIEGINTTDYGIYNVYKIDDENYIYVTRKLKADSDGNILVGTYKNEYNVYAYNTVNGAKQININIGETSKIVGSDTNKKNVYISTQDFDGTNSLYNIDIVNYDTMQVQERAISKENTNNLIVSNDNTLWAYMISGSVYASDNDFKNEKLLLKPDEQTIYSLLEIVDNKIIYSIYRPEGEQGIGIIDRNGNNKFIPIGNPIYVAYNTAKDEMYYTTKDKTNVLMKVNVNTLEKTAVLNDSPKESIIPANMTISSDMKYVAISEVILTDGVEHNIIFVYNLQNKKLINEYNSETQGYITNVQFDNKQITFLQNGKKYIWEFLRK